MFGLTAPSLPLLPELSVNSENRTFGTFALRNVAPGTELLLDYGFDFFPTSVPTI